MDTLREHLDAVFAARNRAFPRRDPDNTRVMRKLLEAYADRLIARRDAEWRPEAVRMASARRCAEQPVFLCGSMKSGTSLVLGLLDGHPQLAVMPGDIHGLTWLRRFKPVPRPERLATYDRRWLAHMINPRGRNPFWFLGPDDAAYVDFLAYLEFWVDALPDEERSGLLAPVLATYCANPCRPPDPRGWVEKTPGNELGVATILAHFPAARFVHVVRDPLTNLATLKVLIRTRGWRWNVAAVAWRLRRSLRAGIANLQRLGATRYRVVHYEDLIADPPHETAALATFLGIEWTPSLLTPSVNGRPMESNSMYADRAVRGAILGPDRAGRWRDGLSAVERLAAGAILSDTLRACGYGGGRGDAGARAEVTP